MITVFIAQASVFAGMGLGLIIGSRPSGGRSMEWERKIQTLESGTAISFQLSAARWKSFQKAQWGICGRETCSALKWFGLLEIVGTLVIAILGFGIALVEADDFEDIQGMVGAVVAFFFFCVVEFRLWFLCQCFWKSQASAPPIIILNGCTSTIHFLQLHIDINLDVSVVRYADGTVLLFEFSGTVGGLPMNQPLSRQFLPLSLYQLHVPVDTDFDLDAISLDSVENGFRLHR